jgi:hypothetical protein
MDKRRPPASRRPAQRSNPFSPPRLPFGLVRLVLGSILATAGAMKLYEPGFEAQDESAPALLLMAFAEFEVLGGLWMVIGLDPERTRRWSAAAFAGLALASLSQALAGKCSCGCFGSLAISPWFALVFDLIAVAALLGSRPPADPEMAPLASPRNLLGSGMLALAVGIGGWRQADLVTVAGTATVDGQPLGEATLTFTGESGQLVLRTDHEGRFRLPLVRPGQYAVSAPGRVVARPVAQPERAAKGRGKKGARRPEPRGPASNPAGVGDPPLSWVEIPKCSRSDLIIQL